MLHQKCASCIRIRRYANSDTDGLQKGTNPRVGSHFLWDTVLGNEAADNDSSIWGQQYLKNLTLELSPVSMMLQNNPQDRYALHY